MEVTLNKYGHSWLQSIRHWDSETKSSVTLMFCDRRTSLHTASEGDATYAPYAYAQIGWLNGGSAAFAIYGLRNLIGLESGSVNLPLYKDWARYIPVLRSLRANMPERTQESLCLAPVFLGTDETWNPKALRGEPLLVLEAWKQYGTGCYQKYPATEAGLHEAIQEHYAALRKDSPRFQEASKRLHELIERKECGEVMAINGGDIRVIDGSIRSAIADLYYRR